MVDVSTNNAAQYPPISLSLSHSVSLCMCSLTYILAKQGQTVN